MNMNAGGNAQPAPNAGNIRNASLTANANRANLTQMNENAHIPSNVELPKNVTASSPMNGSMPSNGNRVANSAGNLAHNTMTQPTINDVEVNIAYQRQMQAPSAAAPPLLVQSLQPINAKFVVGSPTMANAHARAAPAPVLREMPSNSYSQGEVQRRLQMGGFYDIPNGTEIITAIPSNSESFGPTFTGPHVPQNMQAGGGIHHFPGKQFAAPIPSIMNSVSQPNVNAHAQVIPMGANQTIHLD